MILDFVEGTTKLLQFQLFNNGSPIDLTGQGVSLLLNDATGTPLTNFGTINIVDVKNGKVQFAPTPTAFVASSGPYTARWKLTDSNGLINYIPSTSRDIWNIVGA